MPGSFFFEQEGDEIVIARSVEHRRFGDGAGRDDPGDIAVDDPAPFGDLTDLFADCDFVAGSDKTSDIAFGGMMWDAGHRHTGPFAHLAAGQNDVEHTRGDECVFLERFIEIAETKKENRIGKSGFDLLILTPQRNDLAVGSRFGCFPMR